MIPFVDIDVDPSFPSYAAFGLPGADEISEEGFGYFRGTWHMGDVSNQEAIAIIERERHLAALTYRVAANYADFEAIARAIESSDPAALPCGFTGKYADSEIIDIVGDGVTEEPVLDGLEIGVAGISCALTSVGCVTAASCRGHLSEKPWSEYPIVFFAAERSTVQWLTPLVRDSGCGFSDGSSRGKLLIIEAPSIVNLMDLASQVVSESANNQRLQSLW